jgi:CheY-like chemotaxis protein
MKRSVLIIEASKSLRYLLTTILSDKYSVTAVQTSYQAMQLFADNDGINLIVLDISSDKSENMELLEHISTSSILGNIHTVVLSNNNEESLKDSVMELGASAFLKKPFDPVVLKKKIDELLSEETPQIIHKKRNVFNLNINLF